MPGKKDAIRNADDKVAAKSIQQTEKDVEQVLEDFKETLNNM